MTDPQHQSRIRFLKFSTRLGDAIHRRQDLPRRGSRVDLRIIQRIGGGVLFGGVLQADRCRKRRGSESVNRPVYAENPNIKQKLSNEKRIQSRRTPDGAPCPMSRMLEPGSLWLPVSIMLIR